MPKIIIREIDNTTAGSSEYANFSVVVPGFVGNTQTEVEDIFDENGIYECSNRKTFEEKIKEPNADLLKAHAGYQIAVRLLDLGYTVLYKNIPIVDDAGAHESLTALETSEFWNCLMDKANYDFRYVITGGYYNTAAYAEIVKLATFKNPVKGVDPLAPDYDEGGRGDCFALIDVIEEDLGLEVKTQSAAITAIKNQVNTWTWANKYTAIFAPKVTYVDGDELPASFHYLACASRAFENYSEWYAVAGLNRGVSYDTIKGTSLPLGEIAVNKLEARTNVDGLGHSVNVITKIRNNYYIWGNRTAHAIDDKGLVASHFLNIRQLCCTLKKDLYMACKRFTFDPNSDILWINFCNAIRPTLERMKGDQGIKDYKLIKVQSTQKAVMKAKIRIVPIEAVEDFDISVYLEDSISGTTVQADE